MVQQEPIVDVLKVDEDCRLVECVSEDYNVDPVCMDALNIFDDDWYVPSSTKVLWDVNGPVYSPVGDSDMFQLSNPDVRCVEVTLKPELVSSRVVKGVAWERPCGSTCGKVHHLEGMALQLNPCAFFDECMGFEEVDKNYEFIMKGITEGFRIVDSDYEGSYCRANYMSITKKGVKEEMDGLVKQELVDGKVRKVDSRPQCVHSLGAILKPDGSIRPITDCSRGDRQDSDKSINDFMSTTCQTFHYTQVDDVTDIMKESSYFCVLDIKSAYRSVAVHPSDRTKQGFIWDVNGSHEYYEDGALSFGLRCAPFIFTQLTEFVIRCMNRRGIQGVFGYLDDFIIVADTLEDCSRRQAVMLSLLRRLGFHIAWKKVISPSTCVRYLGLNIDSIKMEVSLPQDKLKRLVELVDSFSDKATATKKELQELCGHLAHASRVVRGGRTFSRRVINLLKFMGDKVKVVRLPEWFKDDIHWWRRFCMLFNGAAKILRPCDEGPVVDTDSSMTGFGACCEGDWLVGAWKNKAYLELYSMFEDHHILKPPSEYDETADINLLEVWPVVAAASRWGSQWSGRKVVIRTDNTQVQQMINTGRSRSIRCMWWLRELFWLSVVYNFHLVAKRVTSKDNIIADYLSRVTDTRCIKGLPVLMVDSFCCRGSLTTKAQGLPKPLDGGIYRENTQESMEFLYGVLHTVRGSPAVSG